MAVTAAMVKDLRESTGAGMMDCKKALIEADGDMDKAVLWLREKGLASASARAGKIASEGLVLTHVKSDGNTAVAIEVNSETDFVAKNEEFKSFVEQCAKQAVSTLAKTIDEFHNDFWEGAEAGTVLEALTNRIAKIGENLKIRRFEKIEKASDCGAIGAYVHGGGKIAVLVNLECEKSDPKLEEAGKNVAMQIAAMSPRFISQADMNQEFIDKEREILMSQAKQDPKTAGKPDNVVAKIVEGKLQKEFKEFCLVDQEYIKGEGESVGQYLDKVAKEVGAPIKVAKFVRYAVGEGIEKKEENFAEEVAKVMGK